VSDPIPPKDRLGPLVSYGDAWLAAIIDSSDDAIVSKTLDGIITSWNRGAERMFGYSAEEAVGQHITLIIPNARHSEEDQVLAAIRQGQRVDHFETVRQTKDGRQIHISLMVSPVRDADNRIVGVSKIARDISERKRLEEDARAMDRERRAAFAREQKARAEAETLNRSKDEFLATLSHELRTPLNAVFGWARMLADGQLDAETTRKATDAILRNATAQIQLVEDLVDVSRIVTGKMQLELRPVDLKAVVEAALDAVRPAATAKDITLDVTIDPRLRPIVGAPDRLQQVVWNLLSNAVKFTPRRGRVLVEVRQADAEVQLTVSDTGEGIAADVLPYVFDRFRQGDSGSTRRYGGLGIGLALVRHLVELHGGTVRAESPGIGRGATFTVQLPVPSMKLGQPRAQLGAPHTSTSENLRDLDLLIVDDDLDGLEMCRIVLISSGARVITCTSSAEALEALAGDWWPHILIADLDMPEENGFTLLRRARALAGARGRSLPAVALTAYGSADDRRRILAAGFNLHLVKPVDPEDLRLTVASLAGRAG
jgi:PAS domain S-box-containing protein